MSKLVFLVDDDDGVRLTTAALLEDEGYVVVEASSFAEATAKLGDPFDLLVTDENLGDGSGVDLAKQLGRRVPVILVSGTKHEDDADLFSARVEKGSAWDVLRDAVIRACPIS